MLMCCYYANRCAFTGNKENNVERKVTILDIARESGFSKSAVAYVVNGTSEGRVSQKSCDKINATAAQLGYRPNLAAKRLRGNKSFTIGVLLPSLNDPIYSSMVAEIQHLLTGTDYLATFSFWETEDGIENSTQYILSQGTDAIITVEPSYLPDNLKIPVVSCYNYDNRFDYVGYDIEAVIEMALDYLIGLGHTKIAFASQRDTIRSNCFTKTIKTRKLPENPDWLLWEVARGNDPYLYGKSLMEKILNCKDRPTAVFAHNDVVAVGMLQRAWELGCDIPKDISIIGFDNIKQACYSIPPLTTFQQSEDDSIAEQLLKLTFGRINNPELPQRKHVMNPKLIIRKSTAKAKILKH